jgi:hypothetical protein
MLLLLRVELDLQVVGLPLFVDEALEAGFALWDKAKQAASKDALHVKMYRRGPMHGYPSVPVTAGGILRYFEDKMNNDLEYDGGSDSTRKIAEAEESM